MAELPDYDKIAFDLISKWYQSGKKPPLIELQKDIAAALRTADAEARKQEREGIARMYDGKTTHITSDEVARFIRASVSHP